MSDKNPGPRPEPDPEDPNVTPGLQPGGLVPPGETPPGEDSTAGAGPRETYNPPTGWAKGPLVVLVVIAAMFVILFIGWMVALWY